MYSIFGRPCTFICEKVCRKRLVQYRSAIITSSSVQRLVIETALIKLNDRLPTIKITIIAVGLQFVNECAPSSRWYDCSQPSTTATTRHTDGRCRERHCTRCSETTAYHHQERRQRRPWICKRPIQWFSRFRVYRLLNLCRRQLQDRCFSVPLRCQSRVPPTAIFPRSCRRRAHKVRSRLCTYLSYEHYCANNQSVI